MTDKNLTASHSSNLSNITINSVMKNLHQALKTKTGQPASVWARKIYGLIIAPSKDFPSFLAWFSTEFDHLPKGMKPEWYVGAVRGLVGEFESEKRAEKAKGREWVEREVEMNEVLTNETDQS